MDLAVFVQHVPGRPAWDHMRTCLEESDVGKKYSLHHQPPGMPIRENFLHLLRRMSRAETPYVLRLEDDCSAINRHIVHNLLSWPALHDHRFGVGWGIRLGGGRRLGDRWHNGVLHASLCTLFLTSDLPEIIRLVERGNEPQDLALTRAVFDMGKQVCIHGPSLVENNIHVPSVVGSVGHTPRDHTSCGTFDLNWRR